MKYTQEQFEKLPKWAQSEIKRLEQSVVHLSETLDQINGESETNTYLSEGLTKRPLPKNSRVDFFTDPDKLNKVSVYVRPNGMIDVNADSRTGNTMAILTSASNAFYVKFI